LFLIGEPSLEDEDAVYGTSLGISADLNASKRVENLTFVGEFGGVWSKESAPALRKKMQLCVFRGDMGVLGDIHSSVLTVLDGDKGGVR
jgi:hypothetical protein